MEIVHPSKSKNITLARSCTSPGEWAVEGTRGWLALSLKGGKGVLGSAGQRAVGRVVTRVSGGGKRGGKGRGREARWVEAESDARPSKNKNITLAAM